MLFYSPAMSLSILPLADDTDVDEIRAVLDAAFTCIRAGNLHFAAQHLARLHPRCSAARCVLEFGEDGFADAAHDLERDAAAELASGLGGSGGWSVPASPDPAADAGWVVSLGVQVRVMFTMDCIRDDDAIALSLTQLAQALPSGLAAGVARTRLRHNSVTGLYADARYNQIGGAAAPAFADYNTVVDSLFRTANSHQDAGFSLAQILTTGSQPVSRASAGGVAVAVACGGYPGLAEIITRDRSQEWRADEAIRAEDALAVIVGFAVGFPCLTRDVCLDLASKLAPMFAEAAHNCPRQHVLSLPPVIV
jgi:hypothetical protein